MKSDYERNRFRNSYWIISGCFLAVLALAEWIFFRENVMGAVLIFVLCLIFLTVLYIVLYRMVDRTCGEMERVSAQMLDVMDNVYYPADGQYREGSVGILYSNFEKMVCVLQKSRQKEMEEKIFLRDIISDISHQLKTPLASLNVFVDLLLDDKVSEEEKRRQILTESRNQLNRMEWMVLSMLKLARIEAGAISFEREETPLHSVLLRAREGVDFLIKERNQSLSIDCAEELNLACDGDWLCEAVINLLKNASDYSGENQNIRVEVEQTNVYTCIYIKDEGQGIAEEEIPNIFKRFYRIHREVNPNSVGIGLSLTKSIVEGMGGTIRVKSELGKYTWFILTFVK